MANRNFIANQTQQSEIHRITITGTVTAGSSFITFTVNSKAITYTAVTGDTTSSMASGLLALIRTSQQGEFTQFNGSGTGVSANVITLAAATPGRPITTTGSASISGWVATGGGVSASTTLVQANKSPSDGGDVVNWQGGVFPSNTDAVYFESALFPMLYNLTGFASLSLSAIYVYPSFAGAGIGLPSIAPEGYREYRGGRLIVTACTTLNVELPSTAGFNSFRFNTGSSACNLSIRGQANPGIGQEQVDWLGNHGSNIIEVVDAGLSVATGFAETSLISSIKCVNASVTLGSGVTVNTVSLEDSALDTRCSVPTLNLNGASTATIRDEATVGTMEIDSGTVNYISSGTITSVNIGSGGTLDLSNGRDPVIITNCTLNEGATLLDPYRRVTFTNPVAVPRTGGLLSGNINVNFGTNIRIQISAY